MIDAHAHLQAECYIENFDWDSYLAKYGIQYVVCNGTSVQDWDKVSAIANSNYRVLPSYGVHPWKIEGQPEDWLSLLEKKVLTPNSGIGEIGIDKWIKNADLEKQKKFLIPQLELASKYNKPTTIHCLQAFGHLLEIFKCVKLPHNGFLLHSYSGPRELVSNFLDLGAYFSFSGYFLHERKLVQREIFRQIPIDRILIESDAPDMLSPIDTNSIRDYKNPFSKAPTEITQRNNPVIIPVIYNYLAELKGIENRDSFTNQIGENFKRFWQL